MSERQSQPRHVKKTCAALLLAGLVMVTGCRKQDMADQPMQDTMDESRFFANGQSARPLVEGTVARGRQPVRDALFAVTAGTKPGEPVATAFPEGFQATRERLEAGRQQFEIFCSVCHGSLGDGDGMIVQRGFPRPPSFYTQRLRNAPVGHFYDVISNGYGAMYSYGDRIRANDRWNIVTYIRALQASTPRIDDDVSRSTTQPVSTIPPAPAAR